MRRPAERIVARRAGQGGPGGPVGVCAGGVRAFLFWGDQPAAAGDGREGGSQPYLGPRGFGRCPGDKMIDWVSPPWGVRPLSLTRKLGPGWARGSEPWPERWQGWRMALVVPAGVVRGTGVGEARGAGGKGWWLSARC
jgi:hypothetical protein